MSTTTAEDKFKVDGVTASRMYSQEEVRSAFEFAFWYWQGPTNDREMKAIEKGEEEAWQEWLAGHQSACEQPSGEQVGGTDGR